MISPRHICPTRLALIGLTLLSCAAPLRAADDAKPSPSAPPEKGPGEPSLFRPVLSPDQYEKAIAKLDQDRLDPAKVLASHIPAFGKIVVEVFAGGLAEQAGVENGWTLVRCNGREIWSRLQDIEPDKPNREMVFVTPSGEEKTLHFDSGMLGLMLQDPLRFERIHLESVPRGDWDRDFLAVSQSWIAGRHDVAETALNHAMAKGMPSSPCSDFYAAILALDRGNRERAASLMKSVLTRVAPGDKALPHFYYEGARILALALNDIDLLERCARETEGWPDQLQPADVKILRERGFGTMQASLLPYALAHAGKDVADSVIPHKDEFAGEFSMFDPRNARKNYACSAPVGKYNGLCFTGPEPMHDLIWQIKGMYGDTPEVGRHNFYIDLFDSKLRREAKKTAGWTKPVTSYVAGLSALNDDSPIRTLTFSFGPGTGNMENRRNLPHLNAAETAKLSADFGSHAEIQPLNAGHMFNLTLIRIGNQAEILMNGAPVMHVPVNPEVGELGCEFRFSGCEAYIFSSSLRPITADAPEKKQDH